MALKEFIGSQRLAQILGYLKSYIDNPQKATDSQFGVMEWGDGLEAESSLIRVWLRQSTTPSSTTTVDFTTVDSELRKRKNNPYITIRSGREIDTVTLYWVTSFGSDQTSVITGSGKDMDIKLSDYLNSDEAYVTQLVITWGFMSFSPDPGLTVSSKRATTEYTGRTAVRKMTGAGQSSDGESGMVPAPTSADKDKFLKGDGTWDDVESLPTGGTAAQILEKQSSTDGDADWADIATQMTQAEYDTLTEAEKNDGRLRIITDRGNVSRLASQQTAIDTEGIVGAAGSETNTQALLDGIARKKASIDQIYPVGSVYISVNSANPSALFGGTWELLGDGYLRTNAPTSSGGSLMSGSTTLTADQMPSHSHTATTESTGSHSHTSTTGSYGSHTHTLTTGSYGAHTHTATTGSYGNHTHTLTTQNTGAHTHTLTTNNTGSHAHPVRYSGQQNSQLASKDGTVQPSITSGWARGVGYWSQAYGPGVDVWADYNGNHTHTATTGSYGNHTHTATTQNTGAHTHTLTTGSYGAHTHTATTGSYGAHTHTLTTDSQGAHTHTLTTSSTGGGQGHTHSVEPTYIGVYAFKRTA